MHTLHRANRARLRSYKDAIELRIAMNVLPSGQQVDALNTELKNLQQGTAVTDERTYALLVTTSDFVDEQEDVLAQMDRERRHGEARRSALDADPTEIRPAFWGRFLS
ncbi:MAG: hypothetical protein ACR2PL_08490 [Dehalococcoidia bacterium]